MPVGNEAEGPEDGVGGDTEAEDPHTEVEDGAEAVPAG